MTSFVKVMLKFEDGLSYLNFILIDVNSSFLVF